MVIVPSDFTVAMTRWGMVVPMALAAVIVFRYRTTPVVALLLASTNEALLSASLVPPAKYARARPYAEVALLSWPTKNAVRVFPVPNAKPVFPSPLVATSPANCIVGLEFNPVALYWGADAYGPRLFPAPLMSAAAVTFAPGRARVLTVHHRINPVSDDGVKPAT